MTAMPTAAATAAGPLTDRFPRLQRPGDRPEVHRLEELRARAQAFADLHIRPRALEVDRLAGADPGYFDWDLVRAGADAGLLGLLVPAAAGGAGLLATEASLVLEELCAACPGMGNIFGAHYLGISPLLLGPISHWQGVLAEVVAAERAGSPFLMAAAVTEPEAGTDVEDPELLRRAQITSLARKVPGGYRLSGTKRFISNGSVARWITVMMPTDQRRPAETWTCFLVDARSEGFAIGRIEHKMGQRACHAAELTFDDVFVPGDRVVAREGDGAPATMIVLASSRPPVGAIATGIARGAYERLLAWLRDDPRARGLLDRQHVQLTLAAMAEEIHLARQAYMDAATELDRRVLGAMRHPMVKALKHLPAPVRRATAAQRVLGSGPLRDMTTELLHRTTSTEAITRSVGLSSMAKARGADTAMWVTGAALELIGLRAGPVRAELEKLWRDAKLTQIYEGTNQLNRSEVYRALCAGQTMDCLPPRPWPGRPRLAYGSTDGTVNATMNGGRR